jgi:hypothetical protein
MRNSRIEATKLLTMYDPNYVARIPRPTDKS